MEGVPNKDMSPSAPTEAVLLASRALLGVIASSLAPVLDEVTLPVFRLLVVLTADGPLTTDQLTARTQATDSVVQRTLIEALAGGLVTVSSTNLVRVEPHGRALVDEVTERRRLMLAAILGAMSTDAVEALSDSLRQFAAAAGESPMESTLILGL